MTALPISQATTAAFPRITHRAGIPSLPVSRPGGASRRQAIEQAYDRNFEPIYRFIYYKVGNREDAEDIASQVFMKAAQSLDVSQEEHVQLAWLYQVARTTITDHWRVYYKAPASSLDEAEERGPVFLAAEPLILADDPDGNDGPAAGRARALLGRLPGNYRAVLECRFLLGYSLKETAAALGITEGNAKVIQHRALERAARIGADLM